MYSKGKVKREKKKGIKRVKLKIKGIKKGNKKVTKVVILHGSSPPCNFKGNLKVSDQNNWGGDLSKKLNLGRAKFKGGPKILGRAYEPQ